MKRAVIVAGKILLPVTFVLLLANFAFGPRIVSKVLYDISAGLIVAAILPATLFPICYAKWFPFWKSTLGRALMTKATGMALLIDISVLYLAFGDNYFLREYVRLVVYTLIVVGMWWQFIAIIQIRREDRTVEEQKVMDDMVQSHHSGVEDGRSTHRGSEDPL